MKIFNLLMGLALMVVLVSCGKNETLNEEVTLLGTWQMDELSYEALTSSSFTFEDNSESTPFSTEISLEAQAEDVNFEIVFNEDTYSTAGSYNIVGKMVISENQLGTEQEQAINTTFENIVGTVNYTLTDNKIISDKGFIDADFNGQNFMDDTRPSEMEIIKLTATELILGVNEEWTEEELIDTETTFNNTYKVNGEIKFTKK